VSIFLPGRIYSRGPIGGEKPLRKRYRNVGTTYVEGGRHLNELIETRRVYELSMIVHEEATRWKAERDRWSKCELLD